MPIEALGRVADAPQCLLLRATLPPALAADLGPLFAEVSMYALMAAVLAFRPAGLFSAKA